MRSITPAIVTAAALLSACALTPKSAEDMRANGTHVKDLCSRLQPEEAAKRIVEGWRRCYFVGPSGPGRQVIVTGNVPIFVPTQAGSGDYIDVKTVGSRITVAKGNIAVGNVQLMADIEPTAACPAAVVLRGGNVAWSGKAATAEVFLAKPEVACSEL